MNKIGIYMVTSPTGKQYVGQSTNIDRRFSTYLGAYYPKSQPKLYASLLKHGPQNHKYTILCECPDYMLNEMERLFINVYETFGTKHGMNLKSHSDKGCRLSEETKNKISKSNKGKSHGARGPRPEHIRKKISESHMGLVTRIGFTVPKEVRDRISATMKGRKYSQERINNIRIGKQKAKIK